MRSTFNNSLRICWRYTILEQIIKPKTELHIIKEKAEMSKRKAITICALILFITASSIISYKLYMKYRMEYNPDDYDTYFDEDNVVALSQDIMDKLNKCETYNDVIKIIGKANRVTGSGFFIVGYDTFEGRVLNLTLDPESENGEIICHKIINIHLNDKYIPDTNQGSWDEKNEIFTSANGVSLKFDEYEKLRKKLPDETIIDFMTQSMIDSYLYKTEGLKRELIAKYFNEISFINYCDIYYFDFDVLPNGFDYKVMVKATIKDSEYENIKKAFIENQDYRESTEEEFEELISDEDISKIRDDLNSLDIYMKATKSDATNTNQDSETDGNKIKAAMFSDDTKKMYLFYYNPLMEIEW